MSFLTPLFLLGGLAVALPVVFHLVRRSSRERMVFSSLMFLKPTPPRMTRRNRLEHIFLLLLRCLAICILAMGFARPFLQKPMAATPQGGVSASIIVLVDTSASMKREGIWSEAMSKAEAALKKTSPADRVAVLTFDNRVRSVVSFEQWSAMNLSDRASLAAQQLAESKPSWRSTQLGNALITSAEMLDDANRQDQLRGPRRIILITDLQEGAHLDGLQGYEWPADIEVSIDAVRAKRPTNAGLQWVADADDSAQTAAPTTARIRVSNSSDAEREQFQIGWSGVAGASTLDAYVPPGQSRIVPAPNLPTNAVGERIVLNGDDNDFDNSVYLVRPQAEEINLIYLGDEAENDPKQSLYFVKRAFHDTRRQTVRIHVPQAGAEAPFSNCRLLIVSAPIPESSQVAVRQFVNSGGTAVLVMKDTNSVVALSQLTGITGTTATEAPVSDYAMLGQIDFENPLFAPFADPRFSDFTKIRFWKHRKLPLDNLPGARVVARFDDNDPAILEVPVERGRLIVFTSSWNPEDNQFALSTKFVPMLYSILEQAGGIKAQLPQYRVGDTVDLSALVAKAGSQGLNIGKPDGSRSQLVSAQIKFEQTDEPGIYRVSAQGDATTLLAKFAVNVDSMESKTAPLPVEELERLGVPMEHRDIDLAKQAAIKQQLHDADLESRQKLWRWLIVAALVVLIIETWLAGWITRRSVARVEAAA